MNTENFSVSSLITQCKWKGHTTGTPPKLKVITLENRGEQDPERVVWWRSSGSFVFIKEIKEIVEKQFSVNTIPEKHNRGAICESGWSNTYMGYVLRAQQCCFSMVTTINGNCRWFYVTRWCMVPIYVSLVGLIDYTATTNSDTMVNVV